MLGFYKFVPIVTAEGLPFNFYVLKILKIILVLYFAKKYFNVV